MRFAEIETFRALMRSGSTRKAAALLHVTQPAISQSLKRLEVQAGLSLFQRAGGRLVPTPEARALLSEVEQSSSAWMPSSTGCAVCATLVSTS